MEEKTLEIGKKGSYKVWMDAGYAVFSQEGISGIQVERLARMLSKNKSGFYHFFGDREYFFEAMMKEHLERVHDLVSQIRGIRQFDPEYFQIMIDNKETVLFQMQLVKNREKELFAKTYQLFNDRIAAAVIPVWSDYLGVSPEISCKFWAIIRDTFYVRITPEKFNHTWLAELALEVKTLTQGITVNWENGRVDPLIFSSKN